MIHSFFLVRSTLKSDEITDRFTCTVIYCIKCTLRKKIYIGETGRRLGDRFLSIPFSASILPFTHTLSKTFLVRILNVWLFIRRVRIHRSLRAPKVPAHCSAAGSSIVRPYVPEVFLQHEWQAHGHSECVQARGNGER